MTPMQMREVPVVRLGPGRVLVGHERPQPAEGVVVAVAGAHLVVDPARPEELPSCLVTDADAAQGTLWSLYGEQAAAAVVDVWVAGRRAETTCSVESSEALAQMTQLATTRWCRQLSPLPLDEVLLWLQELVLVGRLHPILDDADGWASDLERACGWLFDRADGNIAAHPVVEELVIEALEILATALPVTDPVSAEARARLVARDWPDGPPESEGRRGRPFTDVRPPLALVAGDSVVAGSATVDWYDVRRGATSMDEGNVGWTVDLAEDRAEMAVSVVGPPPVRRYGHPAAAADVPAQAGLAFDAHVRGWPFVVLTGTLRFDTQSWKWTGVSRVGAAQANLLRETVDAGDPIAVRVRSGEHGPAQNPAWAQAHRWTCRALGAARVAEGSAREVGDVIDAWRRASELWTLVGDEARSAECGRLAADFAAGLLRYELTAAEAWLVGG